MSSRPNSRKHGFSLVEILVVLTITSILTVLTVSSFSSLYSTSLSASGNQVVDVMAMARQNSISKNAYTLVAIKSQGTGAYTSYCLLELTRRDDGNFNYWTQISPWHFLGQGVMFENGTGNDTFTKAANLPTLPDTGAPNGNKLPTTFPFQGGQIDLNSTTVYQCYQPDGTLLGSQNSALHLRLVKSSGTVADYYDLAFVSNTGVTKIERP